MFKLMIDRHALLLDESLQPRIYPFTNDRCFEEPIGDH